MAHLYERENTEEGSLREGWKKELNGISTMCWAQLDKIAPIALKLSLTLCIVFLPQICSNASMRKVISSVFLDLSYSIPCFNVMLKKPAGLSQSPVTGCHLPIGLLTIYCICYIRGKIMVKKRKKKKRRPLQSWKQTFFLSLKKCPGS